MKPESVKDKKETGKPTVAPSKEREAGTARELLKEASKAGVKPEAGKVGVKDDKEARAKPDRFKDSELKPAKIGDKVPQEEKKKLDKAGIKKEAAREDGTTKPTNVTAKDTATLPKAEDKQTTKDKVFDFKRPKAEFDEAQKDKVLDDQLKKGTAKVEPSKSPKEVKDSKKPESDLKAREDEKVVGKPAKELSPTSGKPLKKVVGDSKAEDTKKETKVLAKDGKEPISERVKKFEEKIASRDIKPEDQLVKPQKDSEIQPARRPKSSVLADEKAKTIEEDSKKKEKDLLKSAKKADEDEIIKDQERPTGRIGEVGPSVTEDKAKLAAMEKEKLKITRTADTDEVSKENGKPPGRVGEERPGVTEDKAAMKKEKLKITRTADEVEVSKDKRKPAGRIGEVSPSVTEDKAKQAVKEKEKLIITKPVDKDDIFQEEGRPTGRIGEVPVSERFREVERREKIAKETVPGIKQPDGGVKAKSEDRAKPVKETEAKKPEEALTAAQQSRLADKKAEDVRGLEPTKPLAAKAGKGIGEDVAGAQKVPKELLDGTAQADAIRKHKEEIREERAKLELPKTAGDKERKKKGEFSKEFCLTCLAVYMSYYRR